ncbi:MAG TPA: SusC/RagA family protein [Porphyromonadaceae bacterium]|jgi:TonB-linked SusC/RagA family outer membrane protein|nr:SusC/RagA family protein [Porphyromonadaceae bacterium]
MIFLFNFLGHAQTMVKGKVSDEKGSILIGVNVIIKNTRQGTITDGKGEFVITVPEANSILEFSYLGFETQEISLNGQTFLNIIMIEESQLLNEVVTIGYGAVKKRDLTGSVGSLRLEDIEKSDPTSITTALQGKIAGVNLSNNDGAPGGGVSIQIRGSNSLINSEPLYIVDGIPWIVSEIPQGTTSENQASNPLSEIPPQDIVSVEILKDASATAIYGARGANGVVLITTKKGQSGVDKVEFSTSIGISSITREIEMLDGYDYANMRNEAIANKNFYEGGDSAPAYPQEGYWSYNAKNPNDSTYHPSPIDFKTGRAVQTNWQDEIYRTAITQNYALSIGGGNDLGRHYLSFSYLDQDGIIVNSNFERYSFNVNITRNIKKWLEIGSKASFVRSKSALANTSTDDMGIVYNALIFNPARDVYIPGYDNVTNFEDWNGASNPYTAVRVTQNDKTNLRFSNSNYISIKFSDYLSFRQNIGLAYSKNDRDAYYPRSTQTGKKPTNGYAIRSDNYWNSLALESILSFNKEFAEAHKLNAVLGWTYENSIYGSKYNRTQNFPNDLIGYNSIGDGLDVPKVSSSKGEYALMSYLGRVNYTLKDKYLLTASFREDGSSRFAKGNKWSSFSSYALAWRASEEAFLKDIEILNNLKLRVSYGTTGNQGIAAYATQARLSTNKAVVNGSVYPGYADAIYGGPTNPLLKWETTHQYNAGIDLGIFKNRLNFTAEIYHKKTTDLLQSVLIPLSTGFTTMRSNVGTMINKGLELTLGVLILEEKPISWLLEGNISFNRNKILDLPGDQFASSIGWNMDDIYIQRNGMPIGTLWGYKFDGYYDNEAEVRNDPAYADKAEAVIKSMIGQPKYKNLDNDPTSISPTDRTVIGDVNPDYTFGITNTFEWKDLFFSFFLQGNVGNDLVNTYWYRMNSDYGFSRNIPKSVYDSRWIPEDFSNGNYSLTPGLQPEWGILSSSMNRRNLFSDKMIENGSYIRLKNVNIGYRIKAPLKNVDNIYVYCNVTNLATWTKYSWYDPEVSIFGSDPTRRGVDLSAYPTSRTVTFGIKCTF